MSMETLLSDKRKIVFGQSKTIIDKAEAESREFTNAEQLQLDENDSSLRALTEAIAKNAQRNADEAEYQTAISLAPKVRPGHTGEVRYGRPLPPGATLNDLPGAASTEDANRALGQYVSDLLERRGQSVGTGSGGGFLVPIPISTNLLSLTVGQCKTVAAGASIIPMESETLSLPTVTGLPTLSWRAESGVIPESSASFGRALFTAQSAACLVRVSMEAMEDIDSFGEIISQTLAQAAAVEVDRIGLYGSGASSQPNGLKNQLVTAGRVTSLGTNGAPASYGTLVAAKGLVKGRAYTPTGVILSPRTEAAMASGNDTTGQPLRPSPYLADLPMLSAAGLPTNQTVGTATTTADLFVGDWSKLAIGLRTAVSIRVLDQLYAATGEIGILCWMRLDVQCMRVDAFQAVTGATN